METFLSLLGLTAIVILIYMTTLYAISLVMQRADIVDIGWGLGFILIATLSLFQQEFLTDRMILVFFLVLLWGIRLATHIYSRNKGKKEDYRYLQFKKDWGKQFLVRSYFQIFLLQGVLMILVSIPIIVLSSFQQSGLGALDYIGLSVWVLGFLIETFADIQLDSFLKLKKEGALKEKFANVGLWKYSRHPNYFGEILQWWGIGIIVYSVSFGYIGLIGPVLITYLIIFVSGIPLLEKKFKQHPEWPEYVARTNKLLPLPLPKKLLSFLQK